MAVAVATTVNRLDDQDSARSITAFGGGSQASMLMHRISNRAQLPLSLGPIEATTLGNALAQGIALGWFTDVGDARRALRSDN
jgi:sugar (pentulose or hexulose) kinase